MGDKAMTAIDACPAGWLLEALAGHRMDWVLFPRRSLRWLHHPEAWRIMEDATTLEGFQIPCDCFLETIQPYPPGHLPKSDNDGFGFPIANLSAAVLWRRCVERQDGITTRRGRTPPERIRVICHECLFWAGACGECGTIHWTLSPWVERPEDKYGAMHA